MMRTFFKEATIGFTSVLIAGLCVSCGPREVSGGAVSDKDFYDFISDEEAEIPPDGTCFIYEMAPRLVVAKVMGKGVFLVHEPRRVVQVSSTMSFASGTSIVAVYAPKRKYVDGDFIKEGVYRLDGTFSTEGHTVRKYAEMPEQKAKAIVAARDEAEKARRAVEIRQEEERRAEMERQRLRDAARMAEEERVREEERQKHAAETARVKAESDRKVAEERRAMELSAEKHRSEEAARRAEEAKAEAERQRQHEVEMAKLKMAEEARKAEEAKAEAERKRLHEEEMAKLREEKHKADQARYAEYAEKALSGMQLDPMAYFRIQASLKSKVGKAQVKTAKWNQLELAQKEKNWLQMLSILSGATQPEYPSQEVVDALIKEFFSGTFRVKFEGGFQETEQVGHNNDGTTSPISRVFSPRCFRIAINPYGFSTDGAWDRHDDGVVEFIPGQAPYLIALADHLGSYEKYASVIDLNQFASAPPGTAEIAEQLRDGVITKEVAADRIAKLYEKSINDLMTWLDTH